MLRHEERILRRIASRLKKKFSGRILSVHAFGSRVRGDHDLWSDLDVLIVVKDREPEIESKIMDIFVKEELKSNVFFNPIIKDASAFELEREYNTPFYKNIMREGIAL